MLKLWRMRSTPLLPSLPDPVWPGVVAPNRVLSMSQIELNSVITLNGTVWNLLFLDLTVCKRKNCTYVKLNCLKENFFDIQLCKQNCTYKSIVKLATVVERDLKAPFSIATTPRGGRYSIPRIASLYPWSLPYNAEC